MSIRAQVQFSWGTATEIAGYLGVARELIFDTTNVRLVLMDGVTTGGKPMATEAYVQAQVAGATGGGASTSNFVQWSTCS